MVVGRHKDTGVQRAEGKWRQLEDSIKYRFACPALLIQSLTHRSHSVPHNERLEFLGDGVLNCIIAEELFLRFAKLQEGELSRLRATLVKQSTLAEIATSIQLGAYLRLGEGEVKSGGRNRASTLSDALEALFGAVMLDGGFDGVKDLVLRLYQKLLDAIDPALSKKDNKTQLQEYLQERKFGLPRYILNDPTGPAHAQRFEIDCHIDELNIITKGQGSNRRAAEQEAASAALKQIELQKMAGNGRHK